MYHSFDVDIAEKYGMPEAILLNHLHFWISKNKANNMNFYDGHYWTYNSTRAFSVMFPYLTTKKIKNALNHLIDEGLLITGNYNKSTYDRTLWYALTEKGICIVQKGKCISPKGQMEDAKKENGIVQKGKPIPYINTDTNTDINTDIYISDDMDSAINRQEEWFDTFYSQYPKKVGKADAKKKFKSKCKSEKTFKEIMDGLNKQNQTVFSKRETKYIPNPSTWLNQERWNDEYEDPSVSREEQGWAF